MCACVRVQGGEEVFAVAGSVMWLPQGNAIADSLTLLPPGRQWLWKALVCTGKFKEGDLPEHVKLTEAQVLLIHILGRIKRFLSLLNLFFLNAMAILIDPLL